MSNQYNTAAMAYKAFDIENIPEDKPIKKLGLLSRKTETKGIDYNNPAVRVAKQMQVIRKHRNEINGTNK
jgi:hypothetical protein